MKKQKTKKLELKKEKISSLSKKEMGVIKGGATIACTIACPPWDNTLPFCTQ